MRIGAIVQARMSSRRCPGKVLRPLGDTTVLGYLLNQLSQSIHLCDPEGDDSIARICVATSETRSDDPIARFCDEHGWDCIRGSLDDVAARFVKALDKTKWDAFLRISGDSPFIDPRLVDVAIERFREDRLDLVTNVFPRSYPRGQSVEVISSATFMEALKHVEEPTQREHVTPVLYARAKEYRIANIRAERDHSNVQLAIDTEEDYVIASAVCQALTRPAWAYDWSDLARLSEDFRSQARGVAI